MLKILTLEDLASFCAENKMYKFSSQESGHKLCVRVPVTYEKDDDMSSDSILYVKIKLMHTGRNRNMSNVTKEAAEKCLSTIKYKPILANFCEIDGVTDFTSHDMEIDEDGNLVYLEHQIGCFTVDEPYLEYDKDTDRYYVYAYGAIPREYTKASEIIERKNGTKISAELFINEMSYDAKEKELILNDIEVMGATCLGKNPETGNDVEEGMQGARLDIADFNAENKNVVYDQNEKLIETLENLNNTLSNINIYSKEGGKDMTKFEELLSQYGKTIEEIEFEYDGLTDEELESKFAEAFAEDEGDDGNADDEAPASEDNNDDAEPEQPEEDENAEGNDLVKCSVTIGERIKEFSVSLNAKIEALNTLINDTYSEDMTWYSCEVFDDYVVMVDYWGGKAYRQSYKCKNDVYSLKGDRVEVFSTWMTQDEQKAFENMKANYSTIEEKLGKYEDEPKKMEILNSEDYSQVSDTEQFNELKKFDNHFDLSVEDVSKKADEILLSYAKSTKVEFAKNENSAMHIPTPAKKSSRYGNLFSK